MVDMVFIQVYDGSEINCLKSNQSLSILYLYCNNSPRNNFFIRLSILLLMASWLSRSSAAMPRWSISIQQSY